MDIAGDDLGNGSCVGVPRRPIGQESQEAAGFDVDEILSVGIGECAVPVLDPPVYSGFLYDSIGQNPSIDGVPRGAVYAGEIGHVVRVCRPDLRLVGSVQGFRAM